MADWKRKMSLDSRANGVGEPLTAAEEAEQAQLKEQILAENKAADQQAPALAQNTDDLRAKYKQLSDDSRMKAQSPIARAQDEQDTAFAKGIQKGMKVPGVR